MAGKLNWYFPDAELPPKGPDKDVYGHESVMILNPSDTTAQVQVTLYFTDREPVTAAVLTIGARRVACERITDATGLCGMRIEPETQYAISLRSNVPVIAQYGRLDVRQPNMAFYTTPGYSE